VLLAAPFLFGFGGVARGFYVTVAIAVLAVVAVSRLDADAVSEGVQGAAVSRQTA
jgi:hypothetical protein